MAEKKDNKAREMTEETSEKTQEKEECNNTFWSRHGANIGLAVLIIYVILLGIGTVAEVFEIESILNWWIFRPPGR